MCKYYGSYMRPDGRWAETCTYDARLDLEDLLSYMAKGRSWVVTTSVGDLEREKKKIEKK